MNQKVFHSQSCTGKICENIYLILKQFKQWVLKRLTQNCCVVKFNEFLIEDNKQSHLVIEKSDFVKVQQQYASLVKVEFHDEFQKSPMRYDICGDLQSNCIRQTGVI